MSLTFGFYNSLNGDRKYNALQMSKLFDGIIKDGVFMSIGTSLTVKVESGMDIRVGVGRAWFNHTWTNNDSVLPLTIEQSEMVLNRIDIVVLEVNSTDEIRINSIKVIKGVPASSPVATTLIRTTEVNQYALAHIYVGREVTSLTQANITNKVGTSGTPFVTGILDTIDIDDLVLQWGSEWSQWTMVQQAIFVSWFDTVKDTLDTDAAGNLLNLINTKVSKGATWGDLKGVL